jgi:uncharacterized cupin superfamily protein
MSIQKFTDSTAVPQEYYLAPEKLISGNPKQTHWMHCTDASKKFFAGVWRSEVGKWLVSYTEDENCCILEGTSVITESSSNPVPVTVGESFVIPSGFVGTWEVVTPTKKTFVIYEPGN